MGEVVDAEGRRVPAVTGHACVEPGLGTVGTAGVGTALCGRAGTLGLGVGSSLGHASCHGSRTQVSSRTHNYGRM